jgi:hypothetical protein
MTITTVYYPPATSKPKPGGTSVPSDSNGSQECSAVTTVTTTTSGSVKKETYLDADICTMSFPDVSIYADEKSVLSLPKELFNDAKSVMEMRTREVNGFLTVYKNGVLTLQPDSGDIGNYIITLRMIDKASMQLVSSSMFQIQVLSSGKNPKNGVCPSKIKSECNPKISSVTM